MSNPQDRGELISLLREEYFHVYSLVEEFDKKALTIKAWSVTISMAGIGAGFTEDEPVVFLLAGFSAALFWLIEGHWKGFQQAYKERIAELEAFFEGGLAEISPLQTANRWSHAYRTSKRKRWRILGWPHVYLPHAVVLVVGVVLFAVHVGLRQ